MDQGDTEMKIYSDLTTGCFSMVATSGGKSRGDIKQAPVQSTGTPIDKVVRNAKDDQHKTIIIEIIVFAIVLGIAYICVKGFM
jgi:hypothetical protein